MGGAQGNQNEGQRRNKSERNQNVTLRFWLSPPHQTTGCSDGVRVVRDGKPRVAEEEPVERAGRSLHSQFLSHHP